MTTHEKIDEAQDGDKSPPRSSQEPTPVCSGAVSSIQATRERIKKLNARCRELEEDNRRLGGKVQEQEAQMREITEGRWAQAQAESVNFMHSRTLREAMGRVAALEAEQAEIQEAAKAEAKRLQAALADAEAKRNAEAKEYQSAMSQVVEAEARLARMASSAANDVNTERRHRIGLEARVSELIRQVEAASANCHRQKDEAEELRQQLKGLHEAKLALAVSCAAAQEREALLQAKLLQTEAEFNAEADEKVAALQRVKELESLDEQLFKLQAKVAELTEQLQRTRSSQRTEQDNVEGLQQKVEDLETRNLAISASCAAAEERATMLRAKLTDCDSDRIREACEKEAALKRLAVMESAKQKLEAELQEAAARKAELETNEQRVACTDEMRALQVALAQKLKLAEDRLMIETDEKARALAKIKVLETEASELAEEAAKKETEIADMKEKMAALVELVTDMAAQFDALDEQLMSETAQKAEALRTNKELEFEATARKAELDSKEAEIAGMQWKLAAMEMQVAECLEERLRSEVSETVGAGLLGVPLPSKGGAAVKQTEDLQDQISELKALVAALKMSNSAKGAQAEYLGEKLRAADAQNTEALGKIATLERELAAAQAEVSEKLRQAEACAPELSGRLLNTKAELEARETEVEGLKAQLCEAQALISDLELFSSAKAAQTSALEEQLRSEAYEKALALAIIPRLEAEVAKAILVAQEAKEDLARANVYLAAYHPFAYGKTARVELLLDQLRSEAAEKAEAVARMEELQSQQLRAQVARSLRRHAVLEVQLQAGVAAGRGTGQVALRVKELEAAHAGGQGSAAPEAGRLQGRIDALGAALVAAGREARAKISAVLPRYADDHVPESMSASHSDGSRASGSSFSLQRVSLAACDPVP